MNSTLADVTAVILAGGRGSRLGGQDKGLLDWNGKPLVETLIDQLQKQHLDIVINANRNQDRYCAYGYDVVCDELDDYQGPLAGFAAAMQAVRTAFVLILPCDSPQLAPDYAQRFIRQQSNKQASIVVASDGNRLQPVHALIAVDLLPSLRQFLARGDRKIDRWYAECGYVEADFSDCVSMFRNINTPQDQAMLAAQP